MVLFAWAACAGCTPPAANEAAQTPAVVQAVPVALSVSDAAPPPEVARTADCTVREAALSKEVALRIRPGSRSVAILREEPSARLQLPASPEDTPLRLIVEKNGVLLWTAYDEVELPLLPKRPIALKGVLYPLSHRPLGWQSASGNRVKVRYVLGEEFESATVEDEVPCSALGFNEATYDATDLGDRPCEPGERRLEIGPEVMMSTAPGSPAVLTVRLGQGASPDVSVLRTEAAWAQVCVLGSNEVLLGWVPKDSVREAQQGGLGLGAGVGGMRGFGARAKSPISWRRCDRETPLYAELDGETGEVGRIRAGTRFEPGAERGQYTIVDFWDSWIWPENGGTLMIRTDTLPFCKRD